MMDQQHCPIMIIVFCIYAEPVFFTNDEYEAINGTPENIEPLIEKSFIYKLVRCPSDDYQL